MLRHLIFFEWKFYTRKISFYAILIAFLGLGILMGTSAVIGFPNIKYNSPYAINFILGLFSLVCLLPITITASQSLLREKDTQFEQILYSTPITTRNYFISRFLFVFGNASLTFLLFLIGYIVGHLIKMDNGEKWGVFQLNYYLHSFFIIVLPTIFISCTIVVCTAWLSKNKMTIYLSGLGIYVLYMVISIFSNSPLISGNSPISDSTMDIAAKLDPFGMGAFFEQTRYWSAAKKNTALLKLSGNLLFNRIACAFIALMILSITYKLFKFQISNKQRKEITMSKSVAQKNSVLTKTTTLPKGINYYFNTFLSFLKIDIKTSIKSVSFVILLALTTFVLSMELYGAIEAGIRLPQNFATTSLMINTILTTLPYLLIFSMLFYGSEIVWNSKSVNFFPIENSTPFSHTAMFISKFITLGSISSILILLSIGLGLVFLIVYNYPKINWYTYLSLFYYIGFPCLICSLAIIALQYIFRNKYMALAIGIIFLLATNSSLGKIMGLTHPLTRFANFIPDVYSDINGFGYLSKVFLIKMLYSFSFVLILSVLSILSLTKTSLATMYYSKWKYKLLFILPFFSIIVLGNYILQNYSKYNDQELLDWKQQQEEKYQQYKNVPHPNITKVTTAIHLYPEQNSYRVTGQYVIANKTKTPISELLINTPNEMKWNSITSPDLILIKKDKVYGYYLFKMKQKMNPNDRISLYFDFEYKIEPLNGHQSYNSIVDNGSFIRISRNYPTIGYNSENEIEDKFERKKRKMPIQDALPKAEAPLADPYNWEFINFDAVVSTSHNQTAISIGELQKTYSKNNRNYSHFSAKNIPFRFAVSSAKYKIQKSYYKNIRIELLYDSKHYQNIQHLMNRIKKSMLYCETNFGKYPYNAIRFAEISSFTKGFAATAYPGTIYINEKQFHLNLTQGDGQDIINELTAHELSHQWWGNAQLSPAYREGSGVLTETLAQYTQLMLYKKEYGNAKMLEMVSLYKNMFDIEKAFSGEEPLFTSSPKNTNVIYNKGLIKMYELYLLIGENKINLSLRNLLSKHKYPLQPATIKDLISELKIVSIKSKHKDIEKLFKS